MAQLVVIINCITWIVLIYYIKCEARTLQKCENANKRTLLCSDFIPEKIPDSVDHVILGDFQGPVEISHRTFQGPGWENITFLTITYNSKRYFHMRNPHLKFRNSCFRRLHRLEQLRLHIARVSFENGTFDGLERLKVLDLTDSAHLTEASFHSIIASPNVLPYLRELILVKVGNYIAKGISLGRTFWNFVGQRPIRHLDISYMRVQSFHATAFYENCDNLVKIILRGTYLNIVDSFLNGIKPCLRLRYVDLSSIVIPKLEICSFFRIPLISNVSISADRLAMFSKVETFLADDVCYDRHSKDKPFLLKFGVHLYSKYDWKILTLSLNRNRLQSVDVAYACNNPMLNKLSLVGNGLKFLSPTSLSCLISLKGLNLAENQLSFMQKENHAQFENLFKTLNNLTVIDMSANALSVLPEKLFGNNYNLEAIILAQNDLEYFTLELGHLRGLRYLDLSYNSLKLLDSVSRQSIMNSINLSPDVPVEINLSSNPISCSKCSDYSTITWLLKNEKSLLLYNETCEDGQGNEVQLSKHVETDVSDFCSEDLATVTLLVSSVFLVVSLLIIFFIRRFLRKLSRRSERRKDILEVIRKDTNDFEFLLFLAFSSDDEDFVNNYVLDELRETLKQEIGTDRNLICLGDSHFKVGKYIHNEVTLCLQKTRVVIAVLTNSFIRSGYCNEEFDQACRMKRPIVFMVKDEIDEKLMTETMKFHYCNNTRIIWTNENGRYVLKTSWSCICESVLDLASKNLQM